MHLLDRYALSSGSKVGTPFLAEHFYSLPNMRYWTIHNSSGMEGKNYEFWQDIVDFILPELNRNEIDLVQIGGKDDTRLKGCLFLGGATSLQQTAFILKNSQLHLGNDSFPIHYCSSQGVPTVALYSVIYPANAGPYWNKGFVQAVHPDFTKIKPSFSPKDPARRVNEIKIEEILENIAVACLNPNIKVPRIETVHRGPRYSPHKFVIESSPNQLINDGSFKNNIINFRLDLCPEFEWNNLLWNLSRRQSVLVVDRPFNVQFVEKLARSIKAVMIRLDQRNQEMVDFVRQLNRLGVSTVVVWEGPEEDINSIKMDFFELAKIAPRRLFSSKDVENPPSNDYNQSKYKSSRLFLDNDKIYSSIQAWKENKPQTNKIEEVKNIENVEGLLEEIEHLFIFEETKQTK